MGQSKIVDRLQMMYGFCIQLSDTSVLTYTDDIYRLFKLAEGGAKEAANGKHIQFYHKDKQLVLGDKLMGLYDFNGNTLIDRKYTKLSRGTKEMFIAVDERPGYPSGIVNNKGELVVGHEGWEVTMYSNGLATYNYESGWFNWRHTNPELKLLETKQEYMVFKNALVLNTNDREVRAVYTTDLELRGITSTPLHNLMEADQIRLHNRGTIYTGGQPVILVDKYEFGTRWSTIVKRMEGETIGREQHIK